MSMIFLMSEKMKLACWVISELQFSEAVLISLVSYQHVTTTTDMLPLQNNAYKRKEGSSSGGEMVMRHCSAPRESLPPWGSAKQTDSISVPGQNIS